jgi:hypothetical protein
LHEWDKFYGAGLTSLEEYYAAREQILSTEAKKERDAENRNYEEITRDINKNYENMLAKLPRSIRGDRRGQGSCGPGTDKAERA